MRRKILFQITHHAYSKDFRRSLLRAAARTDGLSVHIQCGADRLVTKVLSSGDTVSDRWNGLGQLKLAVQAICPAHEDAIVLTGVGGAWAPEAARVARLFPPSARWYDVQDDLRYGARGLSYVKYLARDRLWRSVCPRRLALEEGMLKYYPSSWHLGNASDVSRKETGARSDRLVYIGSIDERLDVELFEQLLALRDVDVWGGFHASATSARERLTALAASDPRLTLNGSYDNDDLSSILARYKTGIVPYRADDALTRHINPDKLYHYLSAGLKVVSSPFPQAERMARWVSLVRRPSDVIALSEVDFDTGREPWNPEEYSWSRRWAEFKELTRREIKPRGVLPSPDRATSP